MYSSCIANNDICNAPYFYISNIIKCKWKISLLDEITNIKSLFYLVLIGIWSVTRLFTFWDAANVHWLVLLHNDPLSCNYPHRHLQGKLDCKGQFTLGSCRFFFFCKLKCASPALVVIHSMLLMGLIHTTSNALFSQRYMAVIG